MENCVCNLEKSIFKIVSVPPPADLSSCDVRDIQYHINAEKCLARYNYAFKPLVLKPRCRP